MTAETQAEKEKIRQDIEQLQNSNIQPLSTSGGEYYRYQSDKSGQITASIRVYFSIISGDYIKITKVTGGFTSSSGHGAYVGSGVKVSRQYIDVGQVGRTANSGYKSQRAMGKSFAANLRSWTYYPPSSWLAVDIDAAATIVGVNYYVTLTRSSSWTVHIQAILVDHGVPIGPVSTAR